jgi:hypothetical protein
MRIEAHKRSVAYIAGEVAITAVGILIALGVNSWWQNHQDRKSEVQMLTEMRSELVADTSDMRTDEAAYGLVRGATEELPKRLRGGQAYSQDVDSLFGVQVLFRNHLTSSSAWETLISRGVDLIADDSLRLQVMQYYQMDDYLIKLWNSVDHDLVFSSIRPYFRTHFALNGLHGAEARAHPLNYSQIAADPQMAYMLAERHDAVVSTLAGYNKATEDAVRLMARIDARLRALR